MKSKFLRLVNFDIEIYDFLMQGRITVGVAQYDKKYLNNHLYESTR
jgi:hypothetical protein